MEPSPEVVSEEQSSEEVSSEEEFFPDELLPELLPEMLESEERPRGAVEEDLFEGAAPIGAASLRSGQAQTRRGEL